MSGKKLHHQLLDSIEAELAAVGVAVATGQRQRMAGLLERIDHVRSRADSDTFSVELECLLAAPTVERLPVSCDPAVWRGAVECA